MRILWQCLDCGDNGFKFLGFESLEDPRVFNSIRVAHNSVNPGCTDYNNEGLRWREESDAERDAKLRVG